jgi:hypothetical protein
VLFHDKESRGALSYLALAGEMIRREEEEEHAAPSATPGATVVAAGTRPDNGQGPKAVETTAATVTGAASPETAVGSETTRTNGPVPAAAHSDQPATGMPATGTPAAASAGTGGPPPQGPSSIADENETPSRSSVTGPPDSL